MLYSKDEAYEKHLYAIPFPSESTKLWTKEIWMKYIDKYEGWFVDLKD